MNTESIDLFTLTRIWSLSSAVDRESFRRATESDIVINPSDNERVCSLKRKWLRLNDLERRAALAWMESSESR